MRKRISGQHSSPLFSEASHRYISQRETSGVTPHTVANERYILRTLLKHIGDKPLDQISIRDIEACTAKEREAGRSTNTLNHLGRLAKRFFKWADNTGQIKENCVSGMRVVRVEQAKITPMTHEQVAKLLAVCDTQRFSGARTRLVILLLFDTGLRASEALGIRLADLDMPNRTVQVIGKGGRPRRVCFGRQVASEIQTYLIQRGDVKLPWLFCDEWGTSRLSYNAINHIMQRLAKQAKIEGVRVSCHTLRHSFAREWVLAGGDVASLSSQLGHTSLEMTSRYVSVLIDDVSKVHERVSPADRLATQNAKRKRV